MPLWSLSTIPSLVILSSSPDNTDVVFHQPSVPLPAEASLVGPGRRGAQPLVGRKGDKNLFLPPPPHARNSEAFPEGQGLMAG